MPSERQLLTVSVAKAVIPLSAKSGHLSALMWKADLGALE
jgi:hypothetical protein